MSDYDRNIDNKPRYRGYRKYRNSKLRPNMQERKHKTRYYFRNIEKKPRYRGYRNYRNNANK